MDFGNLYLSTEGRIGRQTYWIAAIILGVISIIVSYLVSSFVAGTAALVISIIWQLLVSYPAYNLMAKRFHDRNKPSSYALYVIIAFLVLSVISLLTMPTPGEMPGAVTWIVTGLTLVIGIWVLIELGFLRGTIGPNQYGPDPVGP